MIAKARSLIESAFPGGVRLYRRVKAFNQRTPSLKQTFSHIYKENLWSDPESVSGRGSTLARTMNIRNSLPALLNSIGAKSILDAACGDFNWMSHVDLSGIEYVGVDVVLKLVEQDRQLYKSKRFEVLDITRDRLPKVDVILCRDCFIHLSFEDINKVIHNFKRSGSAYLLVTTHSVALNSDIRTGEWRSINLELPPFSFPPPERLIVEDQELGKSVGLWKLNDLP